MHEKSSMISAALRLEFGMLGRAIQNYALFDLWLPISDFCRLPRRSSQSEDGSAAKKTTNPTNPTNVERGVGQAWVVGVDL